MYFCRNARRNTWDVSFLFSIGATSKPLLKLEQLERYTKQPAWCYRHISLNVQHMTVITRLLRIQYFANCDKNNSRITSTITLSGITWSGWLVICGFKAELLSRRSLLFRVSLVYSLIIMFYKAYAATSYLL